MGLFDKVKNLFTEEVEVEEKEEKRGKKEEPIKKEVIQVEIPSPVKATRSEKHADLPEETDEPDIIEEPVPVKEEKKFPFFDDKDFDSLDVEQPVSLKKDKKKPSYRNDVYNPPKEEKKVFKPSPIISPVYGILDKDYPKDEIRRSSENSYNAKEASVDEIRNKAYGSLESDIETTLFGKKRVLFDEEESKPKEEIKDDIPSLENDDYKSDIIGEKPRHGGNTEVGSNNDELTDLLNAEMDKEAEEAPKKTPRKISDSELFSLIDSMYEKGDKKWCICLSSHYL